MIEYIRGISDPKEFLVVLVGFFLGFGGDLAFDFVPFASPGETGILAMAIGMIVRTTAVLGSRRFRISRRLRRYIEYCRGIPRLDDTLARLLELEQLVQKKIASLDIVEEKLDTIVDAFVDSRVLSGESLPISSTPNISETPNQPTPG